MRQEFLMQADELGELRRRAGWTQVRMAEAIGVSPNYLAMMERGEKPIERRIEQLIDAFARTRIDVSFSDALKKWVVAVTKPGVTFVGREHHLVAAEATKAEATKIAKRLWVAEGRFPMFIVRDSLLPFSSPRP
jgi:transcriptional regulator with XRE-family HTH domain